MTKQPGHQLPQLYVTAPSPCPYIPGRTEKKVFTHLFGESAVLLNDILSHAGFRRSQNIAYRPSCDGCKACVSVRIRAPKLRVRRSFKRIIRRNDDLTATLHPPAATQEQFSLLRDYLDARHLDGGMADMTLIDYTAMVEETTVDSHLVEYRIAPDGTSESPGQDAGRLVGVALTDHLYDGLSMVYSFYDPALLDRSLGTYMILDHVRRCQRAGLPYVYLGYWVDGCSKMSYKTRFQPLEALGDSGWEAMGAE